MISGSSLVGMPAACSVGKSVRSLRIMVSLYKAHGAQDRAQFYPGSKSGDGLSTLGMIH